MDWTSAGLAKVERDGGSEASSSPYRPLFCNFSVCGGAFTFGVDATFEEALQGVTQVESGTLGSTLELPDGPKMPSHGAATAPHAL